MLGGAASRNTPETFDRWFEAMLSTASLSSVVCWACSRTSDPTSVSRRLRVERSSRRTPSWSSRSATRRLTVEVGILRRRAASEKPFASTTLAKIISEFRSVIVILPLLQVTVRRSRDSTGTCREARGKIGRKVHHPNKQVFAHYPKFGKYICGFTS